MPWVPADADRHKQGLTDTQKARWAKVANAVLERCIADGGSRPECEGKAIRIANDMADKAAPGGK